jgi:hypothetical protein
VLEIINSQKVKFSTPELFNDPFEFRPRISLKSSKIEYEDYLDRLFKKNNPFWNRSQRRSQVDLIIRDKALNKQSLETEKLMSKSLANMISKCGIFCLSEDPASILMWSHYADCHRGICFGFDGDDSNDFFGPALPVKYPKEHPIVNLINDTPSESLNKVIFSKYEGWTYEKEWRIVKYEEGAGMYKFNKSDLKEVIFGCNALQEDMDCIINTLEEANILPKIYRTILHENMYKLELFEY